MAKLFNMGKMAYFSLRKTLNLNTLKLYIFNHHTFQCYTNMLAHTRL